MRWKRRRERTDAVVRERLVARGLDEADGLAARARGIGCGDRREARLAVERRAAVVGLTARFSRNYRVTSQIDHTARRRRRRGRRLRDARTRIGRARADAAALVTQRVVLDVIGVACQDSDRQDVLARRRCMQLVELVDASVYLAARGRWGRGSQGTISELAVLADHRPRRAVGVAVVVSLVCVNPKPVQADIHPALVAADHGDVDVGRHGAVLECPRRGRDAVEGVRREEWQDLALVVLLVHPENLARAVVVDSRSQYDAARGLLSADPDLGVDERRRRRRDCRRRPRRLRRFGRHWK